MRELRLWLNFALLTVSCLSSHDLLEAECRGRCQARGFSSGILIKDKCFCLDPEQDFRDRIRLGSIQSTGKKDDE